MMRRDAMRDRLLAHLQINQMVLLTANERAEVQTNEARRKRKEQTNNAKWTCTLHESIGSGGENSS